MDINHIVRTPTKPHRLVQRLLLALCALALFAPAWAQKVNVCYDFNCKTRQVIHLTPAEWRSVVDWFQPAAPDAAVERQQIRQAIGWMEVVVGRHTPTHRDKGLNLEKRPEFPGQLDCIDESLNTTGYLIAFQQHGHLHWHRVVDRAYRRGGFDGHWAAQIEEVPSGERFVIDSWFQDNGMLPFVAVSTEWQDLRHARALFFQPAD